ncbi:replicative DNA helicase [Massiliimalia timonensis]|uniref:replicative DNA helicase n=1 Tax=Massiliimalia timonensis TaxID=1987501 RepID=UPI000B8AF9D2|nr:DnaB-like helicase C-terminal domain-containing protein [Massiliimalia timonensis]MBS7175919.1 hypothetical protein [Clostridiales bacterium]
MIHYELEETVLGGLLSRPEEYDEYFEQLIPEDFFGIGCREIFEKCAVYRKKHGKVVPLDLGLDEGLRKYAGHCKQCYISPSAFPDHIRILKQKAKICRVKESVEELLNGDSEELVPGLKKVLEDEEQERSSRDYETMAVEQLIQFSQELFSKSERDNRILTGFKRLDAALSGLRMRTVSYVGARPSTGKTAFALNILKKQIKAGKKSVFFSLEMSVTQICERLVSDIAAVNYGRINAGELKEQEKNQMIQTLDQIFSQKKTFIIDDQYTIEAIGGTIADLRPDFVVIDFIQCVRTTGKFQSRRNEVDYISQELKRLAKRYHCHIMGLSQMARGDKTNQPPKMSDLKESGGLEQDGDYIMILHRPYIMDREHFEPEDTDLQLEKNKYGRTGGIEFCFKGEYQRFLEVEKRHE